MKYEEIRSIAKAGVILIWAALIFATLETIYFGCNWFPQSPEELLCDKISVGISAAGCTLFLIGILLRVIQ